jgi:GNAT superfamily N-acetyltransferase
LNYIIREAIAIDMPAVFELINELATFEREPDAVLITVEDLVRDGFGKDPMFKVIVAEVNEGIVGMALYYNRYSTWTGKTIHLEDLIVRQNFRATGLGMALYTEIIKEGKKQKVRRIEWNVLDWNKPAIDFYEKSGAKVMFDWCNVQMNEQRIDWFLESITKNSVV